MKRNLSLILVIILMISLFAGCAGTPSNSDKHDTIKGEAQETQNAGPTENSETSSETIPPATNIPEPELEKLTEQVFRSSDFSEGLAAVVVGGKNGRGCVINKKGEIVFDLGFEIENSYVVSYAKFVNGYMYINGGLLDKNGNMTYPEDVGAAAFYTIALESGYIIAEVIEADFSSTKKMLGIMNTNFEWIVEPTEQLHAAISDEYGYLELSTALNSKDYYYNGFVYIEAVNKCLNVKSGEIVAYESVGFTHPSFTWSVSNNGTWWDYEENKRLDLTNYENISMCRWFADGQAFVVFKNQQAHTTYFTLVNEKGEFLFDPVDYGEVNITSVQTDGETIIVTYSKSADELVVKSYDMKGSLIAEFNTDSIGQYCSYGATICDGVIIIDGGYNYSNYVWYYTTEFEPLF